MDFFALNRYAERILWWINSPSQVIILNESNSICIWNLISDPVEIVKFIPLTDEEQKKEAERYKALEDAKDIEDN